MKNPNQEFLNLDIFYLHTTKSNLKSKKCSVWRKIKPKIFL